MPKHPNAGRINTAADVKDNLLPVLVGGDILTYSYVREFYRAYGLRKCIVLATQDIKVISSSTFTDYRLREGIHDPEVLCCELESIAREVNGAKTLLLLGSDDVHARIFSSNKERLERAGYVVPYIDFDLLDDITQKRRFYELCEELGIAYPKTWYFDCSDSQLEIPVDSFTYPLIAKPSNSAQFQEADIPHKKKIYEIQDAAELERVWKSIRDSDYSNQLVIQDFIPGGDENIHTLTLFADENGDTVMGAGGTVCLQDHDPTALGNPLCIMGEKVDAIYEAGATFLKAVGYHGFANFDIKYDPRDGSYRFFEVNTRCGRNTYYLSLAGCNFVTLFVEDFILGHKITPRYANNPYLFCCVPEYVLKRSMPEGPVKEHALELYRATKDRYPLRFWSDTTIHNLWADVMLVNQIPKFKKFYWDTNGKQLDV